MRENVVNTLPYFIKNKRKKKDRKEMKAPNQHEGMPEIKTCIIHSLNNVELCFCKEIVKKKRNPMILSVFH